MRPRKSTWIWLAVFVVAETLAWFLDRAQSEAGCLADAVALAAALVLVWRVTAYLFRLIVRRLSLRLAFSYFLIGLVPIPLLAALLSVASYIVAHQFIATRLRREITAVGVSALSSPPAFPRVSLSFGGTVVASNLSWLPTGAAAPWLRGLERPGFVEADGHLWLAVPHGAETVQLLDLSDPEAPWLQRLADATGYEVKLFVGKSSAEDGFSIQTSDEDEPRGIGAGVRTRTEASPARRPRDAPAETVGIWNREWIHAFYVETLTNAAETEKQTGHNTVMVSARTSPRVVTDQLFSQGVAGIADVFWVILVGIGSLLLAVYLVALAIAFMLGGSIVRNVNKLTRAAQAVSRGDFSVRVHSKSKDQIGDLARSFDGMADSIQGLLVETAHKERLESEIAMARTIQQRLLPPREAQLPGLSVLAHFESVAEIGGDYYDYLPMRDGRTALALGDVSGHGLPTGLLVAMAKAALATLLEAGHRDSELFGRLNEMIFRATDPRHFMTLCLLAYDPTNRRGNLTNAGQLAPYRISGDRVEPLSLAALPLGMFPEKTFASREYEFAAGELVVFYSDGFIETFDPDDEEFGFERFEAVLRAHGKDGAAALRDAILEAISAHARGRPPDDDRTLMIVTLA